MKPTRNSVALACAVFLLAAGPAHAGRSCEAKRPSAQTIEKGMNLAERTWKELEASGNRVVILARAVQDLSKYGLRYSHIGFAYRQPAANGEHVWRVLHKLNHCGTAEAAIYRQGLGEFFLDDLWHYEAAYAVPSREVQEKLLAALLDERAVRLHHKPYSIVSYAWGRKYQQSNQWAIETLASAMSSTAVTRAQAQAWLQLHGYQPTTLRIGPLTRLGGRLGSANVAFDDHPSEKRFSDRIETVTADSVFAWLERSGLAGPKMAIGLR
ncbi:MAG TPA: DUF2145 domain-containing protein [Paucimonas sp.]|nr:DUF2145 domain-containing protein [Paucimonas sp.]